MTWHPGIGAEIADMFATYAWHEDEIREALEQRRFMELAREAERRDDPLRRKLAVERTHQWRIANRERAREMSRQQAKRDRERAKIDPEFGERFRARKRKYLQARRERQPEKTRAQWRESQRRYREKRRAKLGLPPPRPLRGRPRIDAVDELAAVRAELERRRTMRKRAA